MWPFTKKPQDIPIDITKSEMNMGTYHDQKRISFECLLCKTRWWVQWDQDRDLNPKAECLKCGNSALVKDIQASYRARQAAIRKDEALRRKTDEQREEEVKDGGRLIDPT